MDFDQYHDDHLDHYDATGYGGVEEFGGEADLNSLAMGFAAQTAQNIIDHAGQPGFYSSLPSMGGGTGALLDQAHEAMAGATADAQAIVGDQNWSDIYHWAATTDPYGLQAGIEDPVALGHDYQAADSASDAAYSNWEGDMQATDNAYAALNDSASALWNAYWSMDS